MKEQWDWCKQLSKSRTVQICCVGGLSLSSFAVGCCMGSAVRKDIGYQFKPYIQQPPKRITETDHRDEENDVFIEQSVSIQEKKSKGLRQPIRNEELWKWDRDDSWRQCDYQLEGDNRTDALYHQLRDVVGVLSEHRVPHIMQFGTLIGVARDHSMNAKEVDNDIGVLEDDWNLVFPREIRMDLDDRGIIAFEVVDDDGQLDIWRACTRRPEDKDYPPDSVWVGDIPYTDIYPPSKMEATFPKQNEWFWDDDEIVQRNLADLMVWVPNNHVIEQRLTYRYGDWKVPKDNNDGDIANW